MFYMLFHIALLLQLMPQTSAGATQASSTAQTASEALLRRVLGTAHATQFVVDSTAPAGTMGIGSQGSKVLLRGSSGVEVASALSWYLNEYCNTTFDWSNYEVLLPDAATAPLPLPAAASRARYTNYTYYLNVCTFGYSLVWKDWSYWQKHIDWMAMQGINLPLALAGQEKVIVNTFARFNVTAQELSENYFAGPAFLPWGRMGNLQKWGGPLPLSWVDQQAALQVKLLARMRELGMRPVLSAFAGFIPPAFVAKHPMANVTKVSEWGQYSGLNGTGFYGDFQQTLLEVCVCVCVCACVRACVRACVCV
jgi:alpha-N-acetylglucosaminidase